MALLLGRPAGSRDADGIYDEGSLLRLAVDRARAFWEMAIRTGGGA